MYFRIWRKLQGVWSSNKSARDNVRHTPTTWCNSNPRSSLPHARKSGPANLLFSESAATTIQGGRKHGGYSPHMVSSRGAQPPYTCPSGTDSWLVSCPAPSNAKSEKGSGLPCIEPVSPVQPTVRANQMQERSHMTGELCKECNQRTAQVQRVRGLMYNVANGMFYFLFVSLVNAHPNHNYCIPPRRWLYTR